MPVIGTPITSPGAATLEKWQVSTAASFRPVSAADVRSHLNLTTDNARTGDAYLEMLIDAATQYAQEGMQTVLCLCQITARFEIDEPVVLPRGPVRAIVSVEADDVPTTAYAVWRVGHTTGLDVSKGGPLVVVYSAGYATADAIPADVRVAILTHVGTLYEAPESTADRQRTPVPHSLDAFYQRRNRGKGIG